MLCALCYIIHLHYAASAQLVQFKFCKKNINAETTTRSTTVILPPPLDSPVAGWSQGTAVVPGRSTSGQTFQPESPSHPR